MSVHDDITAEITALREEVAREDATYKKYRDIYNETNKTVHAVTAEYAFGRADGLQVAIVTLGRVRDSLRVAVGGWDR